MTQAIKKMAARGLGLLCIVLGFIGLFLPLLQGVLLLLVGVSLLSYGSPWGQSLQRWIRLKQHQYGRSLAARAKRTKAAAMSLWTR